MAWYVLGTSASIQMNITMQFRVAYAAIKNDGTASIQIRFIVSQLPIRKWCTQSNYS